MESFRDAQAKAGLVLLEPIMNVVVMAPSQYQGSLAGDINRRRGKILNLSSDKGRCMMHAYIPLAEFVRLHQRAAQLHQRHRVVQHGAEPLRRGQGRAGGCQDCELNELKINRAQESMQWLLGPFAVYQRLIQFPQVRLDYVQT